MRIFAYCAQSLMKSMKQVSGVVPLTCPPMSARDILPETLSGYDLLLFDLHGQPGDSMWYGDGQFPALSVETILKADLHKSVVFALNCFLADEQSPMLDALLSAGATYVVAGEGENFAGAHTVFAAGSLAQWFRRFLIAGFDSPQALSLAKIAIRPQLLGAQRQAILDTMKFRVFYRPSEE